MILPTAAILTIILASFLGTVHSILHNVTRLGGNQEVDFPLQSGEINGRMVIVDSSGQRVKLACVNWMGFHLDDLVINGLDRAPVDDISAKIADMGFNCVRLVYALDALYENPIVKSERLSENVELIGKTVMEIMDRVIESLTQSNIMVILNNVNSEAGWCCSLEDGNGLWYTDKYPEDMFFEHWTVMAERYLTNPLVIGADLRNEVRGITKEDGTVTWALWGSGRVEQDWNLAAEEAGKRVLAANPGMLVIVGGIVYGNVLTPAVWAPIQLPKQEKLVYTGHTYPYIPPSDLPWLLYHMAMTFTQLFIDNAGYQFSAPYWMGEFGTACDLDTEGEENWQKLMRLLEENDADWAYWSVDGYRDGPDQDHSFGILESDYQTVRCQWKLEQLQKLMPVLS